MATTKVTNRETSKALELQARRRLIALGRKDGMSESEIGLALRAGSVTRLHMGRPPPSRDPRSFPQIPFSHYDAVASQICASYGARLADLRSQSRLRSIVYPRFATMFLIRERFGKAATIEHIAEYLSRKDHTTVLHGIARAEFLMMRDDQFASIVRNARRVLDQRAAE